MNNKQKYLQIVLTAASERADALENEATESEAYGDYSAALKIKEYADDIRLAVAELS